MSVWHRCLCVLLVLLVKSLAYAHPIQEGTLHLTVGANTVELEVRSTLRPVIVAAHAQARSSFSPEEIATLVREHAPYLARHLRLRAGGRLLVPSVAQTEVVEALNAPVQRAVDLERLHGRFVLHYAALPGFDDLSLEQDALNETPDARTMTVSYVVTAERAGDGVALGSGLLTGDRGFDLDLRGVEPARVSYDFWGYFWAGMRHILAGWDHLLFVSALVVATRRPRDLLSVVVSFTLAHSLTLTLAVLGFVHISASVVEPLIALSIVFVSLDNVLRRPRGSGPARLLLAFGFGLVHGLGFAGPLVQALEGASPGALVTGILGFSLGVELGHQLVALPLFALVTRLRNQQTEWPWPLRLASATTALAGALLLAQALRPLLHA